MVNTDAQLEVVLADPDPITSSAIAAAFLSSDRVSSVSTAASADEARKCLANGAANALVVDIFELGVRDGLALIQDLRDQSPSIGVCLLGSHEALMALPGVPRDWKSRLGHYYKLAKDQTPADLRRNVHAMAAILSSYWLARSASSSLSNLRVALTRADHQLVRVPETTRQEMVRTIDLAETALRVQTDRRDPVTSIVPGYDASKVAQLVSETLNSASRSLDRATWVNTGVLLFGVTVVGVSLVAALVAGRSDALVFGGIGLASVIASLVTSPLNSIGSASRRMVEIQVAYLGFLNQVQICLACPNDKPETAMLISKRLQEAAESVQDALRKSDG